MNVVILGCGRTGASLAIHLATLGHNVTVIEQNPDSLRRVERGPSLNVVIGNGLDIDILERAGVANCDAFFALTRGDNTNLMAAQIVKRRWNIERVAVKVADPLRAEAYRNIGLFCLNASALLTGYCSDWLTGAEYKPIDTYNVLVKELNF